MQNAHRDDQKYWAVTRRRCSCGTAYLQESVVEQGLDTHQGMPVDVLTVMCRECGEVRKFTFSKFLREIAERVDALSVEYIADRTRRSLDKVGGRSA